VEKLDRDVVDVGFDGNRMDVTTEKGVDGVMVWCRHPLPGNFMLEYDFTPVSESGFFLLFFCTENNDGSDILDRLDDTFTTHSLFEKYSRTDIKGYHISYRRNDSPTSNLRKNPGQQGGVLLKQQVLTGVLQAGKTHHVILKKTGPQINLIVNQQEFMKFTDDGSTGVPAYSGGRFGIRQVYDAEGRYRNFRIWDLDAR
jgi:hypothetical protein